MKNQIGFTALICALGMGTLVGCGTEDPGVQGEPIESTSEALTGVGAACTPDPWGVSASSFKAGTNNTAGAALDRILTTRWESEWQNNQWIAVDLGSQMPITTVKLTWETACGKDYDIQTANSANGPWTTVVPVTGNTKSGTANPLTYTLNKTAQFVRMNGKTRCNANYGFSLWEFQINTTALQCNLDRDGDGLGSAYLYCGSCVNGSVPTSNDCNDEDANAKPGQTNYFLTPSRLRDRTTTFDYNCDGRLNWKTTSGWLESDGVFSACTDSTGKKASDCSKCLYNFIPVDSSDCGAHRCSLGAGEVDILCH
jgi:hypothetical protein